MTNLRPDGHSKMAHGLMSETKIKILIYIYMYKRPGIEKKRRIRRFSLTECKVVLN
jgi:hypothetical protein